MSGKRDVLSMVNFYLLFFVGFLQKLNILSSLERQPHGQTVWVSRIPGTNKCPMSQWKERTRKTLQQRQQFSKSLCQNQIIQALNWIAPQRSHNHIGYPLRPGLSTLSMMMPSLRWCQNPLRISASPPRPRSWSWSRSRETEWAAWAPGNPQSAMLWSGLNRRDGDTRRNKYILSINVNVIIYEWYCKFVLHTITLYNKVTNFKGYLQVFFAKCDIKLLYCTIVNYGCPSTFIRTRRRSES